MSKKRKRKKVKINKKIIIGAFVVVAAVGIIVSLMMPEKIDVAVVEKKDVIQDISVTGNIVADKVETLYAPVAGRISDISIRAGETVCANDIIATYDTTLIKNEYEKANAALEATKEGYEAAVTENDKASSKYASAHAAEQNTRSELESVLAQINALDIANRGDYMQPEDYNNALDLEAKMKNLEQDTQINLTEKSAADARLQEAKSYERTYEEAYKDAKEYEHRMEERLEKTSESDPDYEAIKEEYERAKSQRKIAKSRYEDVEDSIEDAEDAVNIAMSKLSQNKSQFATALADLNNINKRNYNKSMSDEEYAQYQALQSKLELLQQDLAKNLSDRQYNESKLINNHTLEQYQHNVDMAEVDVDNAGYTQDLAIAGIRTNKGGVILERFIDSNAMVDAGTPICTLQPMENIKAEVKISRFDIDKIEIGQEADITVGEKTYAGQVTKIFPVAEEDASGKPKVKVWIELDVLDNIPVIGIEAQVVIHTDVEKDAASVPFESVYSDDNGDYVYVLVDGHAEKRYIQIGIKGSDSYSVIDGLKLDDKVITTPFSDEQLDGKYAD